MVKISDTSKFYILSVFFVLANAFLILKGYYYLSFLPLVMAIGMLAFYRLDNFYLLIVFLVPLSIPLYEFVEGLDINFSLPSEILLAAGLLLIIIKVIKGERFDRRILSHPLSVVIYINLAWMFVTVLTSSMPVVSLKYFIARLWFVVIFYLLAAEVFKNHSNIRKYFWAYIIPLIAVIFYSISRHLTIGLFDQNAAHSVMNPFYSDHTSYGAILAMIIPVIIGMIIDGSYSTYARIFAGLLLPLIVMAIVLSYTRAAWVSLLAAALVLTAVRLRIKLHHIFIILVIAGFYVYNNYTEISAVIEKNKTGSSADLQEHVQSITNITNDYSNLERFNRWNCALRMFAEKPVFGWGPGTYMFKYAPFQISREKTPISTNFGDRGNAHSEYLGPLAESGLFGAITFILILVLVVITGLRVYRKAPGIKYKIISMSVLLGLITYFTHGILNNFLDTDKASALFWGYIAILVLLDVHLPGIKEQEKISREK